jgi:hypothetical protein
MTMVTRGFIMNVAYYKTDYEIQKIVFEVLNNKLGIANSIRFMQQYDKGYGDYTKDREIWQKEYTVDSLFEAITKQNT